MARWETCGNDYDEAMRLVIDGQEHVFDSIEWLSHHRPRRGGRRVFFCGAHCAHLKGMEWAHDRV